MNRYRILLVGLSFFVAGSAYEIKTCMAQAQGPVDALSVPPIRHVKDRAWSFIPNEVRTVLERSEEEINARIVTLQHMEQEASMAPAKGDSLQSGRLESSTDVALQKERALITDA